MMGMGGMSMMGMGGMNQMGEVVALPAKAWVVSTAGKPFEILFHGANGSASVREQGGAPFPNGRGSGGKEKSDGGLLTRMCSKGSVEIKALS